MDAPAQKSPIPWPALLAGSCVILFLLACGLSAVLGTGGILLASRLASSRISASPDLAAQPAALEDIRGRVDVMAVDGTWSVAEAGQGITASQYVRTGSLSSASLVFSDGSRALLHANSELAIDALNFSRDGKQRYIQMYQVYGQSDHEVVPLKDKDSVYKVRTPMGTGLAKGTRFQVAVTEEQAVYFYVDEGAVEVSGKEKTVTVEAGQMTTIESDQPPLEPFSSVTVQGVVTQTGDTWIVAGQSFAVNEKTIITGDPKTGDWVMVTGHLLEDETKVADWIVRLYTPPVNEFRLTGKVESIGQAAWKVNGQEIAVTEDTEIGENITEGNLVLVRGIVLPGGKLQASSIQRVDEELGLPFDFTGIVEKKGGVAVGDTSNGDTTWTISGITVTVNEKTLIDADLKDGDMVRVRGFIDKNNVWIAESIRRVEDGARSFQFTGTVESMDPWKVSGITFETREWTEIAKNLKVGDRVLVEGVIDENGAWIATRIEKLDDLLSGRIILIGVVFSTNPWVVSGIPIIVNGATVIEGDIKAGMLVIVELIRQADGSWLAVSIRPLNVAFWFPGCFDIIATVVSIDGTQIQLLNWPLLQLDENVKIENDQGEDAGAIGVLVPGSVVRIRICFDDNMVIHIVIIIIIEQPVDEENPDQNSEKVTVCHKPDKKKGGHTLTISRSALPAHLGHGDYVGACR